MYLVIGTAGIVLIERALIRTGLFCRLGAIDIVVFRGVPLLRIGRRIGGKVILT